MRFKDAANYDAWFATPLGRLCLKLEQEALFGLAAVRPGEAALDLGCGTGVFTRELARRGARALGVDREPAMIERARFLSGNGGEDNPVFQAADAADLPFDAKTFDLAIAVTLLCFASDPASVIGEAVRVLKPGGRLVLGELNRLSYWAWLRRARGLWRPSVYRRAHFFSPHELCGMLRGQGLEPRRQRSLLFFPPVNQLWALKGYRSWERLGGRLTPGRGAFLVVEAEKP